MGTYIQLFIIKLIALELYNYMITEKKLVFNIFYLVLRQKNLPI